MKQNGKYQKKVGKYLKQPVTPDSTEKIKLPLLQTYFASLISLVLCASMFLGTTMAWFTSEVSNTGNEIYVGTLSASMRLGKSKLAGDQPIYGSEIKWFPGYTALRSLTIENPGDLAFNYVLTFSPNSSEWNAALAKHFQVYVYQGVPSAPPDNITALQADSNWKPVMYGDVQATLADIMNYNLPIFQGTLEAKQGDTVDSESYTIALHMLSEAGGDGVDQSAIKLNVKLTAYQQETVGGDLNSTGAIHAVYNAEELKEALQAESGYNNIILMDHISINNVTSAFAAIPAGKQVILDLNGKSLTAELNAPENESSEVFYINSGANVTVQGAGTVDVTANANDEKTYAIFNNQGGTLNLRGGTYKITPVTTKTDPTPTPMVTMVVNDDLGKLTVTGGEYTGNRFLWNASGSATITGGVFNSIGYRNDEGAEIIISDHIKGLVN